MNGSGARHSVESVSSGEWSRVSGHLSTPTSTTTSTTLWLTPTCATLARDLPASGTVALTCSAIGGRPDHGHGYTSCTITLAYLADDLYTL